MILDELESERSWKRMRRIYCVVACRVGVSDLIAQHAVVVRAVAHVLALA